MWKEGRLNLSSWSRKPDQLVLKLRPRPLISFEIEYIIQIPIILLRKLSIFVIGTIIRWYTNNWKVKIWVISEQKVINRISQIKIPSIMFDVIDSALKKFEPFWTYLILTYILLPITFSLKIKEMDLSNAISIGQVEKKFTAFLCYPAFHYLIKYLPRDNLFKWIQCALVNLLQPTSLPRDPSAFAW